MTLFLSYLINGISLGSVYAIIALGYTMVYGIAKMLNFAHGDVIMIGAYISFCVTQYLKLPAWLSVLAAMFVCTLLGQTETQKPRGVAGERGDRLVHLRFDLQKAARGLHIDLPGRGERDGRCAALKDGRAELLLDLPNLLGERRLGDKERFCRGGEAAFADNGEHKLSVACIHGGFPLCDLMSGAPKAPIPLF